MCSAEQAALLDTLSVVIPALNAAAEIDSCIAAIAGAGEIIVVDGGSDDETPHVAATAGATVISSARGRGVQLRRGAQVATGSWLLFLHADTVLEPAWRSVVVDHVQRKPHCAGYFRLRLGSCDWRARLIERAVSGRSRALGLPFGDQGLLISRLLYEEVGGYPPDPLMEDVTLVRRLGCKRLAALDAAAVTSAGRWERDGWARRTFRNLTIQLLYFAGASPERLARLYR